ncbi:hypothetical protein RHMOL_Rhmol07G0220300 [Rhododendron molle]|uniref:Uncharacterized protein n=2 Tax=Rhododendron molle TaxID=49168 RepID=A0ACC0N356_RHOML|nr:hypothetical protein RHMOL_Rhmol07G0220300 [Rhododendron molle]KAI8547759.1 hypothetical protein RHMOL_Rhmol07G0220300 [Rhododendron molle]
METLERDTGDSKEASSSAEIQNSWVEAQDSLKTRLVTEDDFRWQLPTAASTAIGGGECGVLKYVGGVDISFAKDDPSIACGTLVVLDLQTLELVYEDYSVVTLHIPYVPAFLAFREAPILLQLLEKMKTCDHPFYPQVFLCIYFLFNLLSSNSGIVMVFGCEQMLMVDGNGILHPRGKCPPHWQTFCWIFFPVSAYCSSILLNGFGLACHLGVLANLPTIGIGKNLHHVDGLSQSTVRQLLETKGTNEDILSLRGDSGRTWGAAMRSNPGSFKPIYISVGHRVSLATAVKIARMTSKYRVPEPIRQADIRSRDYLRKHQSGG